MTSKDEPMTIAFFFSHDHAKLDDLLNRFVELRLEDPEQAQLIFKKFSLGLKRHMRVEESLIFPLYEDKTGNHYSGPTEVMRDEHRVTNHALERLASKTEKDETCIEADLKQLKMILTIHTRKEEEILFVILDQLLSARERVDLLQQVDKLMKSDPDTCSFPEKDTRSL